MRDNERIRENERVMHVLMWITRFIVDNFNHKSNYIRTGYLEAD